jgi:hypothetical protein
MSGHDIHKGAEATGPEEAGLREQLSALVDDALDPARARFLLRRLQHDAELAACFERWQLAGDALRGAGPLALPAGFGTRVTRAIAAEAAPTGTPGNWRRPWAFGALAASVAVVALFVARPLAEGEPPGAGVSPMASLPEMEVPFVPAVGSRESPGTPDAQVAQSGDDAAAGQRASAAYPGPRAGDTAVAAAEPSSTPLPTATADPFRSPVPPQSRPWPRAVLPGLSGGASDVFTVDYGGRVASGPFAPPATAGEEAAGAGEDDGLPPGE